MRTLCVSKWCTQRFAFCDVNFVSHADIIDFIVWQCYIGPEEEILKNMNLSDQRFMLLAV